jgi:hypothetical protein
MMDESWTKERDKERTIDPLGRLNFLTGSHPSLTWIITNSQTHFG